MKKRPLAVTILSWLLIVVGLVGLVYHAQELDLRQPFQNDTVWVELVRVLAMAWIAFHVVISIFHSWSQVAMADAAPSGSGNSTRGKLRR